MLWFCRVRALASGNDWSDLLLAGLPRGILVSANQPSIICRPSRNHAAMALDRPATPNLTHCPGRLRPVERRHHLHAPRAPLSSPQPPPAPPVASIPDEVRFSPSPVIPNPPRLGGVRNLLLFRGSDLQVRHTAAQPSPVIPNAATRLFLAPVFWATGRGERNLSLSCVARFSNSDESYRTQCKFYSTLRPKSANPPRSKRQDFPSYVAAVLKTRQGEPQASVSSLRVPDGTPPNLAQDGRRLCRPNPGTKNKKDSFPLIPTTRKPL